MNKVLIATLAAVATNAIMLKHDNGLDHHHFQLDAGLSIPLEITVGDLEFEFDAKRQQHEA